jgi:hypothetical protein
MLLTMDDDEFYSGSPINLNSLVECFGAINTLTFHMYWTPELFATDISNTRCTLKIARDIFTEVLRKLHGRE